MYEIRPWLYVGSYRESKNLTLLKRYGIGAILHLADYVEHPDILTLCLIVEDGKPLSTDVIEQGVVFVNDPRVTDKRLLIACGAGISRSVAFAIAALKEREGLRMIDGYRSILKVHPEALPHMELWDSLCQYYGESMTFIEMWKQLK